MTNIGYALSSELHGPNELVAQAERAEEVGFDFATISDHYHPWLSEQGNSPFAWTALGGIAQATGELQVGTGVTCPIERYHPAIVAQAAATTATMAPGRFTLGVGTGELLNEHVSGERWPPHDIRLEMLEEAVEVIRKLWTGETISHHGEHYTVENARLYTVPDERPPIVASAYGPQAADVAGRIGDGFWTVGPQGKLVQRFEDAGGDGPHYGQLSVCYADSKDEAVTAAHERWPNTALPGELAAVLPTPAHFEQATQMVSEKDIAQGSLVTDPDPETHIQNIQTFEDAGFDHVQIHDVGADPQGFFRLYEEEVLPSFE